MSTPPRPKIFITHSSRHIGFARRLSNDLKAAGLEIWFDDKSLQAGQRLAEETNRGLEWCDVFIPILSTVALASPWCLEEINAAMTLSNDPKRNGRPRIIPVLIEYCENQVPALLRSRLFIQFSGRYDEALSELLVRGLDSSVQPGGRYGEALQESKVIPTLSLPKISITHSSRDSDFARRLCNDLEVAGFEVFWDEELLLAGLRWAKEINRGLEWCDINIQILSAAALVSPWYQEEINAAITLNNDPSRQGRPRIISVLIDHCEDQMPASLHMRASIQFTGRYDEALQDLKVMLTPPRPKIFITHSWRDVEFARRLFNDLKAAGFPIWFDEKSLQAGHRVAEEINRGLEWCDVFIPILSAGALASPWCQEEINAAITLSQDPKRMGRPLIVPVLIEHCENQMPGFLRWRSFIQFGGRYDEAFQELKSSGLGRSAQMRSPIAVPPGPVAQEKQKVDRQASQPQEKKSIAPIFISYSHKDTQYAQMLAHALEERGLSVWIDERIDYGTQWPRIIQEHLDNCSSFILIMTLNSFGSDWVQNELSRAKRKGKIIFPLLLEGNEPWLSIEATQYVDVRDGKLPPPRFFDRLFQTIES